ncbi:MAG: hypothetical protein E7604_06725 [Ruminococcaceae bacterium]|nr:hypothetical protein [Oscillospiraceae bacterium]
MKNIFRRRIGNPENESGMMAVEAGIGLVVFMIFMLTIYTMIPTFMAQSMIGHALNESAQSLAIETYGTSILHDGKATVSDLGKQLAKLFCDAKSAAQVSPYDNEADKSYTSTDRWFDPKGALAVKDEVVIEVAKERFATYLAGGVSAADRMLETLGIEDGLDGIDFTGTKLDGSDLTICVSYKISVMMKQDAIGFGTFKSKQSVTSRIWGKP